MKTKEEYNELKEENRELRRVVKLIHNVTRCPYCKSLFTIKRGTRKTVDKGRVQIYECLLCKRRFGEGGDDFRMRHNNDVITEALKLSKKMSTRKIAERIRKKFKKEISSSDLLIPLNPSRLAIGTKTCKVSNENIFFLSSVKS